MFTKEQLEAIISNGEYIGQGVARQVFAISDGMIVKRNIHSYDTGQDMVEVEFYKRWYDEYSDILPEMYGYITTDDSRYMYLFMERVTPLYFIDENCHDVYEYIDNNNHPDDAIVIANRIEEFEYNTEISDSSNNEDNWGLRSDGSVVLLDCGMIDPWFRANNYDHDDVEYGEAC